MSKNKSCLCQKQILFIINIYKPLFWVMPYIMNISIIFFYLLITQTSSINKKVPTCKQVMYNKFHHYQSYTYTKILLFTNRSQHVFWKKANVLWNGILTNFKFIFFITLIYGQNAPFVYCFHNKLLLHKKLLFDFFYSRCVGNTP